MPARTSDLGVLPCPVPIPPFTVKQHRHARYQQDPGNRWLRSLCAGLFASDSGQKWLQRLSRLVKQLSKQ